MDDDFAPVAVPKDDFAPVQPEAPSVPISTGYDEPVPPKPIQGPVADALFSRGKLAAIGKAFSAGWTEGVGDDPFGLDKGILADLTKYGILYDRQKGGPPTIGQAMNEAFLRPAIGMVAGLVSGSMGAMRAVGDVGLEAGLPRDIVALPGAFQGSPGGLGKVEFRPSLGRDVRSGIPTEAPETIRSAATRHEGIVYEGTLHSDTYEAIAKATGREFGDVINKIKNEDVGFVTDTGRFVSREEALTIAKDADQIGDIKSELAAEHFQDGALKKPPKPIITDLDVAKDLGTIGPEKLTPFEERAAAKDRTMAAERKGEVVRSDVVTDPMNPAVDKAGNIRLDLIETSADANNVLRSAAEANGGYMEARRGEISLGHQEQLSQVLGIPVEKLDLAGIGRRLKNDNDLRVSIQAMVQSSEDVVTLARQAHISSDPKDLIKFQEAWMRHDVLQEHVAGLTAEWGRTGNVFQEFRERVKDTNQLGDFLREKGKGKGVNDLKDMVEKLSTLEPGQIPRFLADARKPGFWDKLHYYWVNSILSGQFSQATYLISDAMFATYDNLVIKPIAGAVGAIRGGERAFLGEGAAGFYGYIAGAPEGIRAAWQVLKTGEHPALPREITTGTVNAYTEQRPIGGRVGTVVGLPSRELSMIHALQSNMAYRSQLHSLAYREAAKAGDAPWSAEFKNNMRGLVEFPTEAMMDEAVKYSQRMTFTDPITGAQAATKKFVKEVPGLRFIVPFTNVPMNTLNAAIEGTPLSWMNDKMRANLKGENGKIAQDTQIARLAAGSTVMGMATYWALNDNITGGGPINPEDRAIWLLTHQPNSIKIGSYWVSYDKFAPLGTLLGLGADLVEAGKSGIEDKEIGQAVGHLAVAASNMILNNTGMKGLYDLATVFSAKDKEKELTKWANNFAASFSPMSSATGQIASMLDPNIRDVQTLLDAFKNKIPKLREDLFPVRDWSGVVRANSRSEWGALFKSQAITTDPVDREMDNLNMKVDKISKQMSVGDGFNVELTPKQYDQLQDYAGISTRQALGSLVTQEGWQTIPEGQRIDIMRKVINAARRQAQDLVKMESIGTADDIVRQGNEQRLEWFTPRKK